MTTTQLTRTLNLDDLEDILAFENKKLSENFSSEEDIMFESWKARWRREALEHYLPLGWSFVIRDSEIPSPTSDEGQIVGYFIAQPFLFFEGLTQGLWVEHISWVSLKIRDELLDLAIKLSREKNFQRVIVPMNYAQGIARAEPWMPAAMQIKTTKAI